MLSTERAAFAFRERSSEASDVLERAFCAAAATGTTPALAPLHAAVCEYVDCAKARREPPEAVLIGVKAIALRCGIRGSDLRLFIREPHTKEDVVLRRAMRWCIQRYYGVG